MSMIVSILNMTPEPLLPDATTIARQTCRTFTITVRNHRRDRPLAEPHSLINEFDLRPGESGLVEVHADCVITVTEASDE